MNICNSCGRQLVKRFRPTIKIFQNVCWACGKPVEDCMCDVVPKFKRYKEDL